MSRDKAIKAMRNGRVCKDYAGNSWRLDTSTYFSQVLKCTVSGSTVWVNKVIPYTEQYDTGWELE